MITLFAHIAVTSGAITMTKLMAKLDASTTAQQHFLKPEQSITQITAPTKKGNIMKIRTAFIATITAALLSAGIPAFGQTTSTRSDADARLIASLKAEVAKVAKQRQIETANLANFDDLDFNVFTGQKWDQLSKSHAKDIKVHFPDGRTTVGLDVHVEDLKAMFAWAPDTRINEHPIRIASGEWTAVSGFVEGTFIRPMPIGDDKTIAPTGKAFKLPMVTIGHWTKNGVMDEEWLNWDNQFLMKQIGLAP